MYAFSVRIARQLSDWVLGTFRSNEGKEISEENKINLESAEKSLRSLSEKLEIYARKKKSFTLKAKAKSIYEIYLHTYNERKTKEFLEMYYRYIVLLLHLKSNLKADLEIEKFITISDKKHPRLQEVMKLRIQNLELLKREKVHLKAKTLIAYDAYIEQYSKDELTPDAFYKAAVISKDVEGDEKAVKRFLGFVKTYPWHKLRNSAIEEALAILLRAEDWNLLAHVSKSFIYILVKVHEKKNGKKFFKNGKLSPVFLEKEPILKKLLNARNTAIVKIANDFEKKGKYEKAENVYIKFIDTFKASTVRPDAIIKLATLSEDKSQDYSRAIKYWRKLGKEYGSKEIGQKAKLEQARIYEKILKPRQAIEQYLAFSKQGESDLHLGSLANAAVILEGIGEWNRAADYFYHLHKKWDRKKKWTKSKKALSSSCRNRLFASAKVQERKVLELLHSCSSMLSRSKEGILWRVRAAWALEKLGKFKEARMAWDVLAKKRHSFVSSKNYGVFFALAKSRQLAVQFANYEQVHFRGKNENPDKNIAKKAKALDRLESIAKDIFQYGTNRQRNFARTMLYKAYVSFSEVLKTAAMPSKASEQEREVLKKTFLQAAVEMEKKAQGFQGEEKEMKELLERKSFPKLGSKEYSTYIVRAGNNLKDVEAYKKLTWHVFSLGKIKVARYLSVKWETAIKGRSPANEAAWKALVDFRKQLALVFSEPDPILMEL